MVMKDGSLATTKQFLAEELRIFNPRRMNSIVFLNSVNHSMNLYNVMFSLRQSVQTLSIVQVLLRERSEQWWWPEAF